MELKDRGIVAAWGGVEAIAEACRQQRSSGFIGPHRNALAAAQIESAQLINPVGVISMLVGEQHRIEMIDAR